MILPKHSISEQQRQFLSIKSNNSFLLVNNLPLRWFTYQTEHSCSYSEFDTQSVVVNMIPIPISKPDYSFSQRVIDERVIKNLKKKINDLYDEHQNPNWDGYDAEPLRYLQQSLKFVDTFLFEPILLDTLDIAPENDGCLCFEWFKSKDNFISISVKNDKLIYNYKIEAEEGCGETNFHGKQMLIEKIRKVA